MAEVFGAFTCRCDVVVALNVHKTRQLTNAKSLVLSISNGNNCYL
jgi:hypothetical protein